MARRGVLGMLAGGAAALLSGCGLFGGNSYRYKIAAEVDTPEGMKTGFAVHETTVHKSSVDLGELSPKQSSNTRGEAVAVDLPGAQTLFVLVPGEGAVINALTQNDTGAWIDKAMQILDGDIPAGPQNIRFSKPENYNKSKEYPLLVRFRDINDPKSVELVQPDDLAASFGAGVKLRRLTVEVTDEDVTVGIRERLEWLSKEALPREVGPRLERLPSGGTTRPTFGQRISHGDFIGGVEK